MMSVFTLDHLPLGREAVVKRLLPDSLAFRRKLLSMGMTPGCKLAVMRVAPLGDPIEIRLRGFLLCLRRREAAAIEVEVAA
jgi:ferrous iron transport protein A